MFKDIEKAKCHRCGKVPSLCLIKGEPMCKRCIDEEWNKNRPKPVPVINKQHPYKPYTTESVIPQVPSSTPEVKKNEPPSVSMFLLSMIRANEAERERLRKENEEIRAIINKIK